jgi:hypothetical protein
MNDTDTMPESTKRVLRSFIIYYRTSFMFRLLCMGLRHALRPVPLAELSTDEMQKILAEKPYCLSACRGDDDEDEASRHFLA